jgi:hypothetical protein
LTQRSVNAGLPVIAAGFEMGQHIGRQSDAHPTLVASALRRPRVVSKDCARSGLKSWVITLLAGFALANSAAVQARFSVSSVCGWVLRLLMVVSASVF